MVFKTQIRIGERVMLVHQSTATDGSTVFVPFQCTHCRMNTAGNHEEHCPLSNENIKKYVPDPVEDYSDPTEPA